MWLRALLLLYCLPMLMGHGAIAETVATGGEIPLTYTTAFLIENDTQLSAPDALELFQQGQFAPFDETPALGLGSTPVWLALRLNNATDQSLERHLLLDPSWLDNVKLFHYRQRQLQQQTESGDHQPFASRSPLLTGFLFPLTLQPGEHTFLLRISTPDPMILSLKLLDKEQLENTSLLRLVSYAMSYGFLLALILYNKALFMGIRDRHHLLYALYLSSFLLVNLAYSGHGFAWLWGDFTEWQRWAPPVLMTAFGCCGLMFATSFLHIREHSPLADRLVLLTVGIAILGQAVGLMLDSPLVALITAFIFMLAFTSLMLMMGVYRVLQGSISARFYLMAVVSGTVGTVITTLAVLGYIPFTELSFRAAELGMLVEATLLALALAARIRHVQLEQLRAENAANTDALTQLNNRRALYQMAKSHWHTANRRLRPLSLVALDIDHFKQVNDTYGHAVGDQVLCELGRCIKDTVREGDLAARWGGEEFLIVLPNTTLTDADRFAVRLMEKVRAIDIKANAEKIQVTVSCGVAEQLDQDVNLDDLIRRADQALYTAKHEGRDRVSSHFPATN